MFSEKEMIVGKGMIDSIAVSYTKYLLRSVDIINGNKDVYNFKIDYYSDQTRIRWTINIVFD